MFGLPIKQYVGFTVVVHENRDLCPMGIFYCIDVDETGKSLLLKDKLDDSIGSWWAGPEYVSRLRAGDYAPIIPYSE